MPKKPETPSDAPEDFWLTVHRATPKVDILRYFPYGPENIFEYWCVGKVNLKEVYKEPRNKKMKELDYIFRIVEETGRAVSYLTKQKDFSDKQRLEAFCLWDLFHSGIAGWTKEPLKELSEEEKEELYSYHKDRADRMYCQGKYRNKKQKLEEEKFYKSQGKEWNKKRIDAERKGDEHNRKDNGIYEVKHYPLVAHTNCGNGIQPLYTIQQLSAIWCQVACWFENLC